MEFNRPILWHHGLFLQPQHLQLNDLFHQYSQRPVREFILPYFWGVASVEIQESALENQSFELAGGSFLFPEGTYAEFPGNAIVEPRSFEDAWENRDKPMTVYIGIRKISRVEANVTLVSEVREFGGVYSRFISTADPEQVNDLYQNGQPGQVKRMQYLLKLFWETEKEQVGDYDLIPIARLERVTERVRVFPEHVPPVLSIHASERLLALIKEVRDRVSARGRQLEGYKNLRDMETGEPEARYISYIMALSCLNRHIPLLTQMCEGGCVHPYAAYAELRQLAGELSSFTASVSALGETVEGESIPAYNHTSLWECFSRACSVIDIALADIAVGPEYIIRFERDGSMFSAEPLRNDIFQPRNHFFLVLWTTLDIRAVLDSLVKMTKVSSKKYLQTLITRALPGIEISYLAQPPRELPGRRSCYFFRLDDTGKQWEYVRNELSLALYWDGAPEDLKVELMVIKR